MASDVAKVNASPTKAFFVRMLTRDISLEDCILDLVDNSVDGAWKSTGGNPSELGTDDILGKHWIKITMDESSFIIEDNCGGITFGDAVEYAFTFGRREEQATTGFSVGVYGIGMKRAIFKLGEQVTIDSTYREDGKLHGFRVPIDVQSWLADNRRDWDFDIEENAPEAEAGVTIHVQKLSEEARSRLADPSYAVSLRRTLGRDYMIPLMRGLNIYVNDRQVSGLNLTFKGSQHFAPMRNQYSDGQVIVEIIAGMISAPPDDLLPEEPAPRSDPSGWYVLCNGRVVVASDKTTLTGWGESWQKWHSQYAGFVGLALFSSLRAELLPMTTTKRSVDVGSPVYRRALAAMRHPTVEWISYTNARRQDDHLKSLESDTVDLSLTQVRQRESLQLPKGQRSSPSQKLANVHYAVPLNRLRKLASELGSINMNYREVGLQSFEYAYEMLVDEDDQ